MRFRITAFFIVSAAALGILSAQNPTSIKRVPLKPASTILGKDLFANYCAVCHGPDGKGHGPAAAALKTAPVNLTQLAANNNGKFPEDRVFNILAARADIVAHGSKEMPIWGELFKSLDSGDEKMVHLRISNLTYYVKSIQAK
jgi:mono/diheme cytochrome c family protein